MLANIMLHGIMFGLILKRAIKLQNVRTAESSVVFHKYVDFWCGAEPAEQGARGVSIPEGMFRLVERSPAGFAAASPRDRTLSAPGGVAHARTGLWACPSHARLAGARKTFGQKSMYL